MIKPILIPSLALAVLTYIPRAEAVIYSYYIGTDNQATIPSGTYAGLPNPNYNRLTLLYAHPDYTTPSSSHYHRLGAVAYTGPNLGAGTATFSTNARIPEGANPALPLQPGAGIFNGKLISSPIVDPVLGSYSQLAIAPVWDLKSYNDNAIPNEVEDFLWNSSGGRYTSTITGSDPHFQLVSLSAGLNIGDSSGNVLFANPGDEHHLGDGNTFANWTPMFWTEANAAPGTYSATFRITDEEGLFGDSGEFRYEFQVVPEPGSTALLGGLAALGLLRRRRV